MGDFFATAPGINYFRSLPVGMTDGGFYSNWYMPFNQAQIEFKNEGKTAYTLDFQIHHAPLHQNPDQLLRFHAKWHRDTLLELSQKRSQISQLKVGGMEFGERKISIGGGERVTRNFSSMEKNSLLLLV